MDIYIAGSVLVIGLLSRIESRVKIQVWKEIICVLLSWFTLGVMLGEFILDFYETKKD